MTTTPQPDMTAVPVDGRCTEQMMDAAFHAVDSMLKKQKPASLGDGELLALICATSYAAMVKTAARTSWLEPDAGAV